MLSDRCVKDRLGQEFPHLQHVLTILYAATRGRVRGDRQSNVLDIQGKVNRIQDNDERSHLPNVCSRIDACHRRIARLANASGRCKLRKSP